MQSSDDEKKKAVLVKRVEISKAPAPISALKSKPLDLRDCYTFQPANWDRWRRIDTAHLWEAACLVADIEPPSGGSEGIWRLAQLEVFPKPFQEVWEVLVRDELVSSFKSLPVSGIMLTRVHLGEVAIWAGIKGFKVSPAMIDAAERFKKNHPEIVSRLYQAYGAEESTKPLPQAVRQAEAEPPSAPITAADSPGQVQGFPQGFRRGDALRYELLELVREAKKENAQPNVADIIRRIRPTQTTGGVIVGLKEDGLYYLKYQGADAPEILDRKQLAKRIRLLLSAH